MNKLVPLKVLSYLGLALTIFPSLFVFAGTLAVAEYKLLMLVGTVLWVATAPFWINKTVR
ncbi:MAG: hypothetical protein AAFN92_07490 [Bacteroidota bacterium]